MRIDEKEHPDYLQGKRRFDNTLVGSNQIRDDMAIDAYLQALKEGKSDEEAGRAFFAAYNSLK